jgi:hypothetical protein
MEWVHPHSATTENFSENNVHKWDANAKSRGGNHGGLL